MAANRQATGSILTDVGDLYKRLLNHRPVIQNEVHYFLKEFGGLKREDSGPKNLQDAIKFANEMDTIFLEEIMNSSHQFKQINALIDTVNGTGGQILDDEASSLTTPRAEQEALERQVEDCRRQFHEKQEQYDADYGKQVEQLKEDIQHEREAREKLRAPSSVGSSVTLFPGPPEAQSLEGSSGDGSGGGTSPVQEPLDVGSDGPPDVESDGGKETTLSESEGETQKQTDTADSESRATNKES